MIPFFHSAGHFAYAKSAQIYLQDVEDLASRMDQDEYKKFIFFTCRRTEKFYGGVFF